MRRFFEYLLFLGLLKILALPPRGIARSLGRALGIVLYYARIRRSVVRENLATAFPEKSKRERDHIARNCFAFYGSILVESAAVTSWTENQIRERIQIEGIENLDSAKAKGRGVIGASGHIGWFDISGMRISLEGHACRAVYQGVRNPYIDRYITRVREKGGSKMIRRGIGFREVYKALEQKELVALLADQDAGKRGIFIEFFGKPASTLAGPAEFAIRADAPLITGFVVEEGGGYTLKIEPEIPRGSKEEMMTEYTRRLERVIRKYPEQYFWLHRRWKTTK